MPALEADRPVQKRLGAPVLVVSALLLVLIGMFYSIPMAEYVPPLPPLRGFQTVVGQWRLTGETELETDVPELLRADVTLNRQYAGPGGELNLFVAFFKSQRAGVTPHSPKVCLPGNGWVPETSRTLSISVPGEPATIPVNRYVVSRGENRTVVYYWYQSAHRVVANEYLAKLYLMMDSIRYRRSDTSLVRVVVPVRQSQIEAADQEALAFIDSLYAPLKQQMWSH